jgi:acyl dehydratase
MDIQSLPEQCLVLGNELEPASFAVSKEDLLEYTIVSRDANLIHHDPEVARAAGLPDVIVQGTLKAGLLARFVTSRVGANWQVKEWYAQYRGVDVTGEALVARARVSAMSLDGSEMELDAWLETQAGARHTRASFTLSRLSLKT